MWYLIYNKPNIQLYKYVQSICICELSKFTKYNQVWLPGGLNGLVGTSSGETT